MSYIVGGTSQGNAARDSPAQAPSVGAAITSAVQDFARRISGGRRLLSAARF